jgi:undecaprenyl-diphosphatase
VTLWESVLLGFVQGATEFLPVSSSGHLVIVQALLGVELRGVLYEVAVHVATLVSVLMVYRTRVAGIVRGSLAGEPEPLRYLGLLAVATAPAGVVGVFWKDAVEQLFESPVVPGVALLVTGLILWSAKAASERATESHPGWWTALLIGVAQAFALVPGISRSGTTVVVALWLGMEAREAAAFSFLMAVPAIAGAAVLQLPELGAVVGGPSGGVLLAGSLMAALTGVLAIRTFVAMLSRRAFHLFAPYCWLAGAGFLLYLGLR